MFKYIILICYWIGFATHAYAQNSTIDSLQNLLQKHDTDDTVRVNLLNHLGYWYWIISPETSDKYGQEALKLAEQLNYEQGSAFAYRIIGVSNWGRGNFELALEYLFKSLEKYKAIADELGAANSLMNIGLVYAEQLSFEQALENYFESLKTFEALGKDNRIAATSSNIGEIYYKQGKLDEAREYFEKALGIYNQTKSPYGIAATYNRLGLIFLEQDNLDKALTYCLQSLEIRQQIDDKDGQAKNLENIASIYMAKKEWATARTFLLRGEEIAKSIKAKKWLRDIYYDLKEVAIAEKKYVEALQYFEQYATMKDSLFNEEMAMKIAEMQTLLATKEKEQHLERNKQQIAFLQQQAKLEAFLRNALIIGLVIMAILAYLIVSHQRLKIKKNKELLEKNRLLYHSRQELANAELENAKLKEKELQQELEYKNKELTSYTINFIQKSELMEELKENIGHLKSASDSSTISGKLNSLKKLVDHSFNIDKDWEDFRLHFEQVHQDFFKLLKDRCPELSSSELKLCALVKLNLNIKEMSAILGISPESVKTARYRLRKKLQLSHEESLSDFIMDINQKATASTL